MVNSYNYILNNRGIASSKKYPFASGSTNRPGSCKNVSSAATIKTFTEIADEKTLQRYLKDGHVISIGLDATNLQYYSSGVYSCSPQPNVDHAIAIVGTTNVDGTDVYIVRNSWGQNWGDNGYFYIPMNNPNANCGLLVMASFSNV